MKSESSLTLSTPLVRDILRLYPFNTKCMSLGETPTGRKLQQLFDKYIPLIEDKNHPHRPITIVVITDGVPSTYQFLPFE